MNTEQRSELQEVITSLLDLSGAEVVEREPSFGTGIRPDLFITDGQKEIFIEVTNTASVHQLANLALYQGLMAAKENVRYILAAKIIPTNVRNIAERIDIEILVLPHHITIPHGTRVPHGLLTTEKAWRVSSRLFREKRCSIRHISRSEGISYGWAHRTVKRLISRGIVVQNGQVVELLDPNRLLDAIAWERPLNDLQIGECTTSFTETFEAARTISSMFMDDKLKIPFTAYTSASLYVGHGIRHDALYCYVPDKGHMDRMISDLGTGDGIRLIFYLPDRDVLTSAREVNEIIVTSPSQTLLDLAGLGYAARDLGRRMVEEYARL